MLGRWVERGKFNREIITRLTVEIQARVNYLRDFAKLHGDEHKEACVAEGGVYQGMFSQEINKYFPDRTLYLFGTFEGFDRRDVEVELNMGLSNVREKYYSETSATLVLNRLPHKERTIICKGYFPETAAGLDGESLLTVCRADELIGMSVVGNSACPDAYFVFVRARRWGRKHDYEYNSEAFGRSKA